MDQTKEKSCENCSGDCCSMGHMHGMGGKYHLLRWMLGLAIIIIVFWVGFKLGEFKGYFNDNSYGFGRSHGRGMMNAYGPNGDDYLQIRQYRTQNPGYPMMWQQSAPSSSTTTK